jgi:hypothetical protein
VRSPQPPDIFRYPTTDRCHEGICGRSGRRASPRS